MNNEQITPEEIHRVTEVILNLLETLTLTMQSIIRYSEEQNIGTVLI